MSALLFRSSKGWACYLCACGCNEAAKIWPDQEVFKDPRYYVRHHAPLGCDASRLGDLYNWEAESEPEPFAPIEVMDVSEWDLEPDTDPLIDIFKGWDGQND